MSLSNFFIVVPVMNEAVVLVILVVLVPGPAEIRSVASCFPPLLVEGHGVHACLEVHSLAVVIRERLQSCSPRNP